MATYAPLASVSDLTTSPLNDIFRNMNAPVQTKILTQASRALESYCNRRLAPFTGLPESHRAQNIDPDEQTDVYTPLDQTAMLGLSRAQSLGSSELVRHDWLRETPVRWPDLWTGSIQSITIWRAVTGSQVITDMTPVQYEADTGHVRFSLGTYLPQGSTIVYSYSGGYSTIPDELNLACLLKSAQIGILYLEPEARPNIDTAELTGEIESLLSSYIRDGE
jgi:hypothetical protein